MKQKLANILLNWAAKLHPETYNVRVTKDSITVDIGKMVLTEDKWHSAALYTKFDFKRGHEHKLCIDGAVIDDKPIAQ